MRITKVFLYLFLIFLLIICLLPFYLMIINSTRSSAEINNGISFIPGSFLGLNLTNLLETMRMANTSIFRALWNSFYIAILATLISSYFSTMTAFGFAFYKFRLHKFLFIFVLGTLMIPPQLSLIGFFQMASTFNLIDNHMLLYIPAMASGFTVFFLRQYIKSTIPYELLQAARIDGAREIYTFHMLILPLLVPAIATMAIFSFIASWNNYILPLILLNRDSLFTIPLIIAKLNSTAFKTDFGVVYIGVAISVIPIIIIFVVFSRFIISSISSVGIKG